ncbi:late competence protein ComER [Tuberibacillus sp. Marseille-P3662]|uniref:late competence protein ComER n=1 Tax=Tuberibacillus sp. Marseille-P3662 TaxID=1965358 RepID=UPI000A1CB8DA|nr:late competence protein ComER [Tuberibacillus sp. Marseille-P3662]
MKIGIIGTGNMGTVLTQAIVDGLAVPPSHVIVTNRTLSKAYQLQEEYPNIQVAHTAEDVAKSTDITFICIKPLDIHPLLIKIRDSLDSQQTLVSITSPIKVEQIESAVDCHVARLIPSITNRALSGTTLFTFGQRCGQAQKDQLLGLAENFSDPVMIDESVTRAASDLCSCGPAFLSYLMERMVNAAVSETGISEYQATQLTSKMVVGLGHLLEKQIYTMETLKEKVRVKGGVTGKGLDVLETELGDVFEQLFQTTHEKFREDHNHVDKQFEAYTK